MSVYKLTCLNCEEEIEETTNMQKPSVVIFDCLRCGKSWGVATTTVVPKGPKGPALDSNNG